MTPEAPEYTDEQPVVLTVAGSDCSGGAGLQADLKTFSALGVYGLTAITCAVSEVPGAVQRIVELPADFVGDQVRLLGETFPIATIKTGMLYAPAHVEQLAAALDAIDFAGSLVVDPVMVATSGDALIRANTISLLETLLLPRATVITPNLDEAAALLDRPAIDETAMGAAARLLHDRTGCAVLLKGGHLEGDRALDILIDGNGEEHRYEAPFIREVSTHGTGCTLSAAIAARLACGAALPAAVADAKDFITQAIRRSHRWNSPGGPIHALYIK